MKCLIVFFLTAIFTSKAICHPEDEISFTVRVTESENIQLIVNIPNINNRSKSLQLIEKSDGLLQFIWLTDNNVKCEFFENTIIANDMYNFTSFEYLSKNCHKKNAFYTFKHNLEFPDELGFNFKLISVLPGNWKSISLDASNKSKIINLNQKENFKNRVRLIIEGIKHILYGLDHLLFLLSILLGYLASNNMSRLSSWKLVFLVSAFALSHMISLNYIQQFPILFQANTIEICISITLIILPLMHFLKTKNYILSLVIIASGFIHGAGFNGGFTVLIDNHSKAVELVFLFGFGILIAQLGIIIPLFFALYKYASSKQLISLNKIGQTLIILLGIIMLIERTLSLGNQL